MSDIVEDILGRKFEVEQDEKGNEVWRSQEYPEFTFKSIEKYKDEDGNCLLYADKFGASTCEYDEANEIIRKKENNVTEYPTELVDIMPVTNQMFVPLVNNKVVLDGNIRDNAVACNAMQDSGMLEKREYIQTTRYHGAYVAPGSMVLAADIASVYGNFNKETNVLYRNIKRKTATIDTPLEQIKTVASMLNANQELRNAIPHPQFNEIMTDFAENASLALKEHPEQAQQIFDAFNSIKQSDVDKAAREYNRDFYEALAKNAPQVFIDNASLIHPDNRIRFLPDIAVEHKRLALQAFDAMPSLKEKWDPCYVGKSERYKAFSTFLDMQLPDEDKEKMFTILFNDKITTSELIEYADGFRGVKPSLDKYIENHNTYSDEFCEALMHLASSIDDAYWINPYIDDMIKKQKTLSVEFCRNIGKYAKRSTEYTGEYLQALGKLPVGVDKTEFYKNLADIIINPNGGHIYSRLSNEDRQSAIDYITQSPEKLSPEFCEYMIESAKDMSDWRKYECQPILKRIVNEDISYFYKHRDVFDDNIFTQQVAIKDHSLIPSLKGISRENFDAFAKIYEEEYAVAEYDIDERNMGLKNVVLEKENEIMTTIKDNISKDDYYDHTPPKPVQVWLVKNAKKFPNLVSEILKEKELPYVEMCVRNIENPEKENIASLLNRLEAKKVKSFADFQDAQEFVARRDMCMRACHSFNNEKQQEYYAQNPERDHIIFSVFDSGQLSYAMAESGVDDFKTAERVAKLFYALNERPETYSSSYNQYYPKDLLPIAKSEVMQDWMYPVMMGAIEKGGLTMSEGRMPSERTLFDCCKAWKINPAMPQRLAKFVGTQSLKGRMLAGAIFDKMVTDGKTTPEEWRDNKVLHEKFYEELARAEKMPREKAFQQYIPNTPVNRKRVIGMGMKEKGIENTPENFKALYREAREQGVFEKLLAKPEEARTTFSSRLLVETARRKAARE